MKLNEKLVNVNFEFIKTLKLILNNKNKMKSHSIAILNNKIYNCIT